MELTYRKAAQSDAIQVLYIALVLLFVLTGITPPFSPRIKCNKDGIVLLQRRPTGEHDPRTDDSANRTIWIYDMLSLDNWRIPGNWLVVNARAKAAPSHVRPFLELAETVCREKKLDFKFYTLSNNGFVGGRQNEPHLRIYEGWCQRSGCLTNYFERMN